MTESLPLKVMVVYQHLPLYRRDVFLSLDSVDGLDCTFVADTRALNGVKVMDPDDLKDFVGVVNYWRGPLLWQRGLLRTWWQERPDVTVALGDVQYLSTWALLLSARVARKRVYLWTIGWVRREAGIKRMVRMAFFRLADGLLLYGDGARGIGAKLGYPEHRMTTIYNSSATPEFGSEPETWSNGLPNRSAHRWVIGAVIRLQAIKELDMVVRAAAVLRGRGEDVAVLLVGDGPERGSLEKLAEQLSVPLYMPGAAYSRQAILATYNCLDITVVPNLAGLTAIQSMAAGVPVISHDDPERQMPESESIVPGVTGERFAPGDLDSLVDALGRATSRLSESREEVSRACRDEVESRWSAEAQTARILSVLTGSHSP